MPFINSCIILCCSLQHCCSSDHLPLLLLLRLRVFRVEVKVIVVNGSDLTLSVTVELNLSAPRLPSWQANFNANPPQSSILSERSSPSRSVILQRQVLRHCFPLGQAQVSIVTDYRLSQVFIPVTIVQDSHLPHFSPS